MKKTYQQMMDDINLKLMEHNQTTRVISYTGKSITLSSGIQLNDNDKSRFCKRIFTSKSQLWISNMDKLFLGTISESEIRSQLASLGGQATYKKYGETMSQRLNTGVPWNAGTKGQNIGNGHAQSQETKDKISKKNSGAGNGMYGVEMSEEAKYYRSCIMKQKILLGEFTPNSNNRNTHWDAVFDDKPYRSSWEALYQYINPKAEYEKLRIEYTFNDEKKIYIVDFVDHSTKQVIEVKPKELCVGEQFNSKMHALTQWAILNDYTVIVVDYEWLKSQNIKIDYTRFDERTSKKIKKIYEIN